MSNVGKVRVYELARELGMDDSKPLLKIIRDMGYDVKTASNTLSNDAVKKIREVVAPHVEQARREAEVAKARAAAAEAKKAQAGGGGAVRVGAPAQKVRIVSRATDAEKEALLDRHRRRLAGESVESAMEAKAASVPVVPDEPAPAPEPTPPPVLEAPAPRVEPTVPPTTMQPAATTPAAPAEREKEPVMAAKAAADGAPARPEDDGRGKPLPPDQMIAQEYRDRQAPQPPAAPPTPPAPVPPPIAAPLAERFNNQGGFARPGNFQPGASSPKTREISPTRQGAGGPGGPPGQQQRRPGGPNRPGGMPQNRPGGPGRPGHHHRPGMQGGGGRGGPRRDNKNAPPRPEVNKNLHLPELISVSDLATRLQIPASDVIKYLIREGQMVSINQALDYETASKIAVAYGFTVEESQTELPEEHLLEEEAEGDQVHRPPVVTVLGHVDHGKTSLLDAIRKTEVTATEAGGITQRIGAYTVTYNDQPITFIDTPGHEAFTQMRARGARVTDIAILVVAADDGVMPQTVEAINHAKAAKVPIIVAVNKIDKPNANPDRVLQQLTEYNLVPEAWGGDTITVNVSAVKGDGLTDLLEMLLLTAEVQELKANPDKPANGIIIEAALDKGLGPVATVLVQSGTLKVGDTVVVGKTWGRVRILHNEDGQKIRSAGPSYPAEIIGLSDIPEPGDTLQVVDDERMAKQVAEARASNQRTNRIKVSGRTSLEDFFATQVGEAIRELRVLVKADGQGSLEALIASLEKLSTDEVKVSIVHNAVGAIRESDIMLASASNAIIIGFNVRPDPAVKRLADQEGVEIRLYRVIYHMLEEVRKAMAGLLAPDISEEELGRAEVRQVFKITKVGKVAGCMVTEGKITRDAEVRVVRDGLLIYEGKLESLKRFKDDVREVTEGYECGLSVLNYPDLQEGDVIEAFHKKITVREEL